MIGARLGAYEITGKLGEGGMGEVFRATDPKLKREVAIKVLPAAFAEDPDRLARFEREAQVLAQLQHPNIASIYGLEESGGVRALVMELVEGEDLAERLKRGPLPLDEALAVARQIAEALEAAHEKGIVHRDLKPANVKLTPDGKVKVLDFGLARAMDPAGASAAEVQNSPTLTAHPTQAGVLLGTAAYMAPEQARGRPVDRRADIWAFGVVLFEMLTGKRLFDGETVSDVLAAVLTREVDFGLLPPSTPPAVANVLRRCLARDPRERLSWIGEARHLLVEAPQRAELAFTTPPRPRALLLAALPWAVAAALAAALLFSLRPRPSADVVAAELLPLPGTAFDLRVRGPGPAALSPDGSRIAFAAQARDAATLLYVRTIADGRVTEFPGSEGAQFPFWSPDGRWVAFFSRVDGKLKKAPVDGGTALTICRALNGKGGSWGRDDVIVMAPSSGSALWRVSASGGEPAPLTRLDDRHNSHRHPRFLPDGRTFLYLARSPRLGESEVLLGSVDGAPPRLVMKSATQAEYASGHLLFARESVLMAQPFDSRTGAVTGQARPVVDGVLVLPGASFSAFSASATGRLAFHSGEPQAPVPVELRDRKGLPLRALGGPGNYRAPAFSPDGRWIATSGYPGAGVSNIDLWLLDTNAAAALRFTLEPTEDVEGTWSPDGKTLFYGANPNGPHDIYRKSVDGAGKAELVHATPGLQKPTSVSRDGKVLLFDSEVDERMAILALDLESGQARPLREGPFSDAHGVLSPDGRWLAFDSDETGRPEVYVTPFPGPGRTWPLSTDGGRYPAWREDGREIVYAALDGRFLAVPVTPEGDTFRAGAATELFRSTPPTRDYRDWGMSPDGQLFAVVPSGVLEAKNELRLVVNWPARRDRR
jgi:Tol biopolymer transport system component